MEGSAGPAQLRIVGHDRVHWQCEVLGWRGGLLPSGRASFGHRSGHRSKTACCLLFLASPRILQGRSFMAQRITTPKTKQGATTNKAMGAVRLGGMTFWGIVLGGGPIVLHAFHMPVELVVRFL